MNPQQSFDRPWFKYWPQNLPRELDYPRVPIFDIIERSAHRYPDKAAVIFYGRKITYSELYRSSIKLAGHLHDVGIRKGDRVAVCIGNSPHWHVCAFGVLMSGAILVSVNPLLSEGEFEYVLRDSGARALICLSDVAETMLRLKDKTYVEHIVCGHWMDYLPSQPEVRVPDDLLKAPSIPEGVSKTWSEVMKEEHTPPKVEVGVDDKAMIIYTSGTTGVPKGVVHTHRTMWPSILGSIYWFGRTPAEVNLSSVAIFHVTGLVHNLYSVHELGATAVLMARWNAETAAEIIQKYRVTFWFGIPTIIVDFLKLPNLKDYDLSSLKIVGGGGAPMPEPIAKKLEELTGVKYIEAYGYTESFSQTHIVPPHRVKYSCLGIPHFGVDSLIIDPETLKVLPPNDTGEIVVSAPNMFIEYWNKPEETKKAFIEINGRKYFRSGDLGFMDEDGYFFIRDRIKRMINRAGYKVWPTAVENVLYGHPAIAEVCVVKTPDPRVLEEVKAYVVLKPEYQEKLDKGEITGDQLAQEIIEWSRQRMAKYEYPRIIEFVKSLPKTASGKILWRVVQEWEEARSRREERGG